LGIIMAEFILETNYPSEMDKSSRHKAILAPDSSRLADESSEDKFRAKIRLNTGFICRRFIHLRRIVRLRWINYPSLV